MGAVTLVFIMMLGVNVPAVAILLDVFGERVSARFDDLSLVQNVDTVGLDPTQNAVVVRDEKDGDAALAKLRDLLGDELQCVDIETGIYLINDDALGRKERELQYLHFLLFAAGKSFVEGAREEFAVHFQRFCRVFDALAKMR